MGSFRQAWKGRRDEPIGQAKDRQDSDYNLLLKDSYYKPSTGLIKLVGMMDGLLSPGSNNQRMQGRGISIDGLVTTTGIRFFLCS